MGMLTKHYARQKDGSRRFEVIPRPGEGADDIEAERVRLEAAYRVPLALAEVRPFATPSGYGPVYVLRSAPVGA